ncbi:competence protein CoiA [Streptomyces sp. NPDC001373]|uniref:competence protein CoiA n=1 Tax=Streptomyces sp. NPDC001373 TaxID=3364565 RepID=UPI0036AF6A0C
MGFTAHHDHRGQLDATQPDLGCNWAWESIHRASPRVSMTCPECRHPVHAKVSRYGLRFFAHDPGSPTCALAGESVEHHLLKLELATAIRATGHHAELEVRGPGGNWRADVMASSPDGTLRMAWEAQLSPITTGEVSERTTRFAKDGVRTCWVATRLRPWVGEVPSIHTRPPSDADSRWVVAGGLARFTVDPCKEGCRCPAGHGEWHEATTDLQSFVAWVLSDRAVPFRLPTRLHARHSWTGVWTAPSYIDAAAAFAEAEQRARAEQREHRRRRLEQKRLAELQDQLAAAVPRPRQVAPPLPGIRDEPTLEPVWEMDLPGTELIRLNTVAVEAALALHNVHATTRPPDSSSRWALGTPMYVGDRPYGVLRPRPQLVDWRQLKGLVIFVRNHDELRLLGRTAPNGTRIIVLEDDSSVTALPQR